MSDFPNALVTEPQVFVVGKTTFDPSGLDGFIKINGLNLTETFIGSPIQKIRDGADVLEGADDAEIMAEFAGRFCYRSWLRGRPADEYLANVVEMRHGSVLEHVTFNLAITGVSRALTHELIRHRAGFAVSQESQRYVDAADIRFVVPPLLLDQCGGDLNHPRIQAFYDRCEKMLGFYKDEQAAYAAELEAADDVKAKTVIKKRANEAARSVLPNAAETRLTWTGNLRALRHFCELRGDEHADLEIRRLAAKVAALMLDRAPYAFFDMTIVEGDFGVPVVAVEHSKV